MARQYFLALFTRRDKYIRQLPGRDWEWRSGPLLDYEVLGVISDEGRGIFRGCAWAHKTRFAVLDIDKGSKYHSALELETFVTQLAAIGLTATPYQSSASGGWHLYIFFDDWADSDEVASSLKTWFKAHNYQIKCGTLEVFPSGQALRLPLQSGFAWLANDGSIQTTREEIREEEALASFLSDLEENKRNWTDAKSQIERQIEALAKSAGRSVQAHEESISGEGFETLFAGGKDVEKYERGREYWLYGLKEKGQRHDAVMCTGHYLWYGDEESGVRALPGLRNAASRVEKILGWLKEKHNGLSGAINAGQWSEVEGDIERACHWSRSQVSVNTFEPYLITDRMIDRLAQVPYLTPDDLKLANERREDQARKKIKEAYELLTSQGRKVTKRQLMRLANCHKETLKKHSDIWCISNGVITRGAGDYSGGARVSCPLLVSSACSENKSFNLFDSVVGELEVCLEVLDGGHAEFKDFSPSCLEVSVSRPVSKEPCFAELVSSITSLEMVEAGSLNSSVAPLFHAWLTSLPESTQCKAQALRVAAPSLTPGPMLSGSQALRHVTAGGFSLCLGTRTVSGIFRNRLAFKSFATSRIAMTFSGQGQVEEKKPVLSFYPSIVAFRNRKRERGPPATSC